MYNLSLISINQSIDNSFLNVIKYCTVILKDKISKTLAHQEESEKLITKFHIYIHEQS